MKGLFPMKARAKQDVKVLMEDDRFSDFRKGKEYRCAYIGEDIILIDEQHMGYKTDMETFNEDFEIVEQ